VLSIEFRNIENTGKMCTIMIHKEDVENVELFPNWADEVRIPTQPIH